MCMSIWERFCSLFLQWVLTEGVVTLGMHNIWRKKSRFSVLFTTTGKDSVLTSKEGQAIFYIEFNQQTKSWIGKSNLELYSTKGKQMTTTNCQNPEISKINVMNFDYWQPWITTNKKMGDYFRLVKSGKSSAISIMVCLDFDDRSLRVSISLY